MDDDLSNVVPFRKPDVFEAPSTSSVDSDASVDEPDRPHSAVDEDPELGVELDRLAANLRELEWDGVQSTPPESTSTSGVYFEPDELTRRAALPRWSAEDDACVATAAAFRGRFGFTRNRRQRFQVLCLVHDDDLTDDEVRLLWRARNLVFDAERAYNDARLAIEVFGHALATILGLLITMAFIKLLRTYPRLPTAGGFGLFVLVVSALLGLMWAANTFYIRPHQLRRRAAAQRCPSSS